MPYHIVKQHMPNKAYKQKSPPKKGRLLNNEYFILSGLLTQIGHFDGNYSRFSTFIAMFAATAVYGLLHSIICKYAKYNGYIRYNI